MKAKPFFILLGIAAALSAAAFLTFFDQGENRARLKMGDVLLDDLPTDRIQAVEITGPDSQVLLTQGETGWVVANRHAFPADFGKLSDLVDRLKEAKAGRSFPGDEKVFARLALNPPEKTDVPPEARGTRVAFKDAGGQVLGSVLLGAPRDSAASTGGHYLRLADDPQVHLIDATFRFLDKAPEDWIQKTILDVPAADIRQVICRDAPEGPVRFVLERPSPGAAPALRDAAAGERLDPAKADKLFGALAAFRITDVGAPDLSPDAAGIGTTPALAFHLFDGRVYTVSLGSPVPATEDHFLKIEAGFDPPAAQEAPPEGAEAESPAPDTEAPARAAADFNRTYGAMPLVVSDWVKGMFITDRQGLCRGEDSPAS